jgi:hypothetical protein
MLLLSVAALLVAACGGDHMASTSGPQGNRRAASVGRADPAAPTPGRFSIARGGVLKDPQGRTFTPVGVNVNGPRFVWPENAAATVGGMAAWHFNTIRVNTFSFCHRGLPCYSTNNNLGKIVNAYTRRHYVVIISNHDYGAGIDPTAVQQKRVKAWWKAVAARYRTNPYVWFDPINEPSGHRDTSDGETNAHYLARWWDIETNIADSVHADAPQSMLVIDGASAGQDKGTWACTHTPDFGKPLWSDSIHGSSAGIVDGHALQARYGGQHVVFSPHMYGQWAGNRPYGCRGPASDPYRYWRYDMNVYFDKLEAENLPVLVGEWGATNRLADESFANGGSWEAAHILMEQVAPRRTIKPGVLNWHCTAGDGYALARPDDWCLNYDPGHLRSGRTLLWQGQDLFNYAKLVNP